MASAFLRSHALWISRTIRPQDGVLYARLRQQALSGQAESMLLLMWPKPITREVILKGERWPGNAGQSMDASHLQFWAVEEGSKNSQKVPEKREESVALGEQGKKDCRERWAHESPAGERRHLWVPQLKDHLSSL